MFDIMGVGETNIDIFIEVDHIPAHDEKIRGKLLGKLPGGITGNFCCAASKFGASTAVVAKVGNDDYGKICIQDFINYGINIDGMVVKDGEDTFFCVVHLDPTGEKALTIVATSIFLPTKEEVNLDLVRKAKYVHMTTLDVDLANYVFESLDGSGCRLSLDIEPSASKAEIQVWKNILKRLDIAFLNAAGLKTLTKTEDISSGAQSLLEDGVKMVVVTCGVNGVKIFKKNYRYEHPSYKVEVKDTTGAGDCFNAVFIVCLSWGWTIEKAAKYASAAAALSIQAVGSRGGLPTCEEVENFLKSRGEIL